MPDCPHIHVQDSGLQAFRAFIREETDDGQTIGRFLIDAMEGRLPDFKGHHRLEAAKMLRDYGSEVADEYIRNYTAPKPRRSTTAEGSPVQEEARPEHEPALSLSKDRRAEGRDPIIDPIKDEMARFIREETNNGQSIVRNLIQIMEAREDPYKPNHNLDAARQLTDNGFPVTGDLLCATECTHHAPAHPERNGTSSPAHPERSGAESKDEGDTAPDPAWLETLQEIKRMEDEGQIDKVDYDPFKPVYDWAPKEAVMPYADEVADAFRAELDLRAERRANWPEIEERRRKKHAEIYPSHSDDDTEDPPNT